MIALGVAASAIVLAMTPAPRQVVQTGPTGPIAVSKQGYVAVVDGADTLHIYHLASRTLVRSIAASALNGNGGLVHPVILRWDDTTNEIVLPRGSDVVRVGVDGTLKAAPFQTTRLWPVGGNGKARWISRQYGDAEVLDAGWASLGKLANSESIVAAADGKSALVAAKDGTLHRFTLDPVAKHSTIKLPAPADDALSGSPIAVTADGTTAAVCLKTAKDHQAVLVRGLDKQATVTPIKFDGGMSGCDVALAELHGIVVVATAGELRGFDLATGALRWQAPREYGLSSPESSEIAISGRTLLVSWRGLVMIDVVRGDVIGQVGTDLARPTQSYFLRGDQLLTTRPAPSSIFGSTGSELSTWSLKDGTRTATGSAMWGSWAQVGEDGVLSTVRYPTTNPDHCWLFSRGTTGDGAPVKEIAKGAWPPTATRTSANCVAKANTVAGVDFATGAIVAAEGGTYAVFSIKGARVPLENPPKFSLLVTFSPDGKYVMGTTMTGPWASQNVWDTKTGKRRWFTGSATDPEAVQLGGGTPRKGYTTHAVSADSQQIAVAGDNTVTVYALATKKPLATFALATGWVSAVAFAPGAIVAGTSDGRLVISRGGKLVEAASDGGAIGQIAVRSDGKRAATISDDGAVRIWDLAKPALLVTLVDASDGEAFASTPNGAYAGGREAAEQLGWVFDGPTEGFKFERFAGQLARPDIVAKRLADATTDLTVAIARPPRVTITSQPPPSGTTLKLGARVETTTTTGTVKLVRAFVNGRAVAAVPVDAASKDIVIDVALEAGSNVVTLVAFDDAGRSSNPRSVDVGTAPAATRPDVWVIAAGVGWYPNLPVADQLEGSVNDAYAIADAFDGQAGPGKRYDKAHITVLEDEQVTADAVDKALAQLAQMKPTDVAVVFLAGHGVRLPKTEDMVLLTGAAKLDKTTWATSGIGWTKIGGALAKAKGRVIVLLDACHAGNVTQERIVPNTQLADDLVGSQRAGVLVFAASKGSQKSLEANAARAVTLDEDQKILVQHKRVPKKKPLPPPPPQATPTAPRERRGNGYFTGAVVAALDSPVTDINRDGVIQTAELITQVQLRVLRASRGKQTPWVARRELFGDFALSTASK